MSDTNSFINAYIDNAVGMIHENISAVLQLKTQLKISNDLVAQKDSVIGQLMGQIEQLTNSNVELAKLKEHNDVLLEKNRALINKTSHLDALLKQVNEMKLMIQQKDLKISQIERDREIKTDQPNAPAVAKEPESTLNTKSKKMIKAPIVSINVASLSSKAETDDF